jgi:hypothetical protein
MEENNCKFLRIINVLHYASMSPAREDIFAGNVLPEETPSLKTLIPILTEFIFVEPGSSQYNVDLNQNIILKLLLDIERAEKTKTLNDYGIEDNTRLDKVNQLLTDLANASYWRHVKDDSLAFPATGLSQIEYKQSQAGAHQDSHIHTMHRRNESTERTPKEEEVSSSSGDSPTDVDESEEDVVIRSRKVKEVVQPAPFTMETGLSLRRFLQKFERYFKRKYNGDAYEETTELEKFLKGELLNVYHVAGGAEIRYDRMKKELLSYYDSQKTQNHRYWKEELQKTTHISGESLVVYAMRLKNIALKAYTNKSEMEKELNHHFKKTTPKWFKQKMENKESITKTVLNRKLTWEERIELAKQEERKRKKDNNNATKEIQVTFSDKIEMAEGQDRFVKDRRIPINNSPQRSNLRHRSPDNRRQVQQYEDRRSNEINERSPDNRNYQGRNRYVYPSDMKRQTYRSPSRIMNINQTAYQEKFCTFCGRKNHYFNACRLRQKQCLLCGGNDHFFKECSKYREPSPSRRVTCPFCSENHLGRECNRRRPLN